MPFPSVLSSFSKVAATDRLDSPSHSALHNSVSSAVGQLEAVIGVEGNASVVGTLEYFIKSPDSNGGGHVQTANKGGTGQTTFTKGDLLVATSSSVVAKLAVGSDGQTLVANSGVAAGVNWALPGAIKTSGAVSVIGGSVVSEQSILTASVPANTLGSSGAIRTTLFVNSWRSNTSNSSIMLAANYGTTRIASVLLVLGGSTSVTGNVTYTLISNGISSQTGIMAVDLYKGNITLNATAPASVLTTMVTGTASEDNTVALPVGLTLGGGQVLGVNEILEIRGYTVEAI